MTETKVIYKGKLITIEELISILKKEFSKNHIGQEEGITLDELVKKNFSDYAEWTVWKKYTYFDIIRRCIASIRRKGGLFIINKGGKFFVLKTQGEANYYKNLLKRDIASMNKSIEKADEWVEKKKWKNI